MRKRLLFAAVAALALPGFADELLDEVLRRDSPSPGKAIGAVPTQAKPADGVSTEAPEASAPNRRDGEEWLMRHLRDAEGGEEQTETASPVDEENVAVAEIGLMGGHSEKESDDGSAAGMERSSRISLSGGGGGDGACAFSGEWTQPLGKMPFDFSLRGFFFRGEYDVRKSEKETYYTYTHWYSRWSGWHSVRHKHTRTIRYTETESFENYGGEALVLCRPFRGKMLSPFAGVGVRIERAEQWGTEAEEEVSVGGCAGVTLNLGRFSLTGGVRGGKTSWELIGGAGWRLGHHVVLTGDVDYFETDEHDGLAFGGGLTWVF